MHYVRINSVIKSNFWIAGIWDHSALIAGFHVDM